MMMEHQKLWMLYIIVKVHYLKFEQFSFWFAQKQCFSQLTILNWKKEVVEIKPLKEKKSCDQSLQNNWNKLFHD